MVAAVTNGPAAGVATTSDCAELPVPEDECPRRGDFAEGTGQGNGNPDWEMSMDFDGFWMEFLFQGTWETFVCFFFFLGTCGDFDVDRSGGNIEHGDIMEMTCQQAGRKD